MLYASRSGAAVAMAARDFTRSLSSVHTGTMSLQWGFAKIGQSQTETRRLCCLERSFSRRFHLLPTKNGPGPGQAKYSHRAGANPGLLRHDASLVGAATPSFLLTRGCKLENESRKFWRPAYLYSMLPKCSKIELKSLMRQ